MNIILATIAVALLPSEGVVQDRCDVIEVNHYHGDDGRLIQTQVIFWDYQDDKPGEQVAAWRLWKNPSRLPTKNQFTGEWELLFNDEGTMRMVTAGSYRETWTQFDREMESRRDLPKSEQRGLTKMRPAPSTGW